MVVRANLLSIYDLCLCERHPRLQTYLEFNLMVLFFIPSATTADAIRTSRSQESPSTMAAWTALDRRTLRQSPRDDDDGRLAAGSPHTITQDEQCAPRWIFL